VVDPLVIELTRTTAATDQLKNGNAVPRSSELGREVLVLSPILLAPHRRSGPDEVIE